MKILQKIIYTLFFTLMLVNASSAQNITIINNSGQTLNNVRISIGDGNWQQLSLQLPPFNAKNKNVSTTFKVDIPKNIRFGTIEFYTYTSIKKNCYYIGGLVHDFAAGHDKIIINHDLTYIALAPQFNQQKIVNALSKNHFQLVSSDFKDISGAAWCSAASFGQITASYSVGALACLTSVSYGLDSAYISVGLIRSILPFMHSSFGYFSSGYTSEELSKMPGASTLGVSLQLFGVPIGASWINFRSANTKRSLAYFIGGGYNYGGSVYISAGKFFNLSNNLYTKMLSLGSEGIAADVESENIYLTVPSKTDLSHLPIEYLTLSMIDNNAPSTMVTANGTAIQSGSTIDASDSMANPVKLVISSQGGSPREYSLHVSKELDGPVMENFFIDGIIGRFIKTGSNTSDIVVSLPFSLVDSINNLSPNFTTESGTTVTVNGQEQTSGVTSQDFTKPVQYTVAANGQTNIYTVRVNIHFFKPYYPSGCRLDKPNQCTCVKDPQGGVWFTPQVFTHVTLQDAQEYIGNLNQGNGTCGRTNWQLPTPDSLFYLQYGGRELAEGNFAKWFAKFGFLGFSSTANYWIAPPNGCSTSPALCDGFNFNKGEVDVRGNSEQNTFAYSPPESSN